MHCNVYRSDKKPETYLYLARSTEYEDLPEDLQRVFGQPELVISLELDASSKLAQVSAASVIEQLKSSGYFLQLPPKTPTEEEIRRWIA